MSAADGVLNVHPVVSIQGIQRAGGPSADLFILLQIKIVRFGVGRDRDAQRALLILLRWDQLVPDAYDRPGARHIGCIGFLHA